MARRTIQILATKSANKNRDYLRGYICTGWNSNDHEWVDIDRTGEVLCHQSFRYYASEANVYEDWIRVCGIGFLIPESIKNKVIVSASLNIYSKDIVNNNIKIVDANFAEENGLNKDWEVGNWGTAETLANTKLQQGWNKITLTRLSENMQIHPQAKSNCSNVKWEEIYSHRHSIYKPYLEITYDDIPPKPPTSLYPAGMTVSTRDVIRFSWLHNSEEGLPQKAFELQYSTNGGSTWITVNQTTYNQYYDMAPNTLPASGTVTWRVRTTDTNDSTSEYTITSFALGIAPQKAPIPIQPIGAYLDSTKPILFEWHFMGGSPNERQSKYDLQYSINGGSTWTTITETTTNKYKELPANTFNITGNVIWRIRTHNNFNEVSPYSENRTFYVISSPPIPQIISVSNNSRPTITWTSQGQHIYEIQVIRDNEIIIDTGSIPSVSDRSYKILEYLEDGNYKVRLRVINEYNLYSPWAEKSFTISTTKPQKPIITVYGGEYSVTIKGDNLGSTNLIYRDNIYIGELTEGIFIDYTGENNKEHQYFIRVIDSNDNFSDSDIKLSKCKFRGNTLALISNPSDFIRLRLGYNARPKKSNKFGVVGNLQYFDGREYPVMEFSEFSDRVKALTFFVRTIEEVERIIEMIKKRETFLYRNKDGKNIYGAILEVNYEEDIFGYEIGFAITQTDYKGVAYD